MPPYFLDFARLPSPIIMPQSWVMLGDIPHLYISNYQYIIYCMDFPETSVEISVAKLAPAAQSLGAAGTVSGKRRHKNSQKGDVTGPNITNIIADSYRIGVSLNHHSLVSGALQQTMHMFRWWNLSTIGFPDFPFFEFRKP